VTAALGDAPRPPATLAVDAVRLLRERTWLRSLALVAVFAVLCIFLGRWQWNRHLERVQAADQVTANYDAAPVPLVQLLPTPDTSMASSLQWRQATIAGTYLADRAVLIRNRPYNGDYGYEVVVPLRTASGAVLLVDRGWLPNGTSGAHPDSVPAPPTGQVEVVARLQPTEPSADRSAPAGQAVAIDVPALAANLTGPTYRAYAVLAQESPATAAAPRPLARPDTDLGNNLAYALQWWFFAAGAVILLGYYAFREAQNRDLRARGIDPVELRRLRRLSRREPAEEEW
jgi:cytochrome oxidase assembly protein ShyY1